MTHALKPRPGFNWLLVNWSRKTALVADLLARVIRKIPNDLRGIRDKALLNGPA